MLGWTQSQLARAADVTRATVAYFEAEKREIAPYPLSLMRHALEAAGIIFVEENGEALGVSLRRQRFNSDSPEPSGPATELIEKMDVAIETHRASRLSKD